MDTDRSNSPTRLTARRTGWIWWSVLGVLLVAPTVRVIALAINAQSARGLDLLMFGVTLPIVVSLGVVVLLSMAIGRGLPRLRRMYPNAIAVAMVLAADNVEIFTQLTGIRLGARAGYGFDTTFEDMHIRFWRGIRPRLIAEIRADGITYEAGQRTTIAGISVPAVIVNVPTSSDTLTLRISPQDERSKFYPKKFNRDQVAALVQELRQQTSP